MKRFLMMMTLIGLVGNWNSTLTAQLVSPDSLYLNEELPEISIVAVKPLIKAEADKTTYSIAEDPDSRTYTLLEMLRKVPLVTVDGEDNVKVNGQSSFKIYMNGRPSNMFSNNPKEVLRSIPASMIKKVEVITDPGARYDAEGVSGILNIVTKGAELEGYSATMNASATNIFKNVGGFATLKYGRLSLSGNYSFTHYSIRNELDYVRSQQGGEGEGERLTMFSDIMVKDPTHFGGLEGSLEIDSLNLISLSGNLNIGNTKTTQNNHYDRFGQDTENLIYAYNEDKDMNNDWGGASVKADYQHLFRRDKSEMLTLSYQYDYIPDDTYRLFHNKDKVGYVSLSQLEADYIRQVSSAYTHEHTVQLDYVNPFTDTHSLEGGLKFIRRNSTSHSASDVREGEEDTWSPSESQPRVDYRHVQNILSAYAGYGFKYAKWSLNPGLRMESTWQDVTYSQGKGENFDYRVTDWIPSWTSSFRLNDRNLFRLAYNVRLRRPSINYLNPTVFVSGTLVSYGNPGLVSEKHHRFTASYSYNGTRLNIQASLLYTIGNGVIDECMFIDSAGVIHSTYDNLVDVKAGGGSLYVSYNPTTQTSISVNGLLNYLDLRSREDNKMYDTEVRNSGFCGSAFLDFSQKFKHGWRFVLSGGYVRMEPTMGMDSSGYYFYGMSVVKGFLKDRLTCALRAQDFLEPYKTLRYNQSYPGFSVRQSNRQFGRAIGISISYRIGDLKASVKKAGRSIKNDDLLNAK
ncbi:MAG: outer membrane beta-barrel family protein [Parabacteroides sp.]|nr:outer membrane beta-barrel family protein [Parabacteroides sp.]